MHIMLVSNLAGHGGVATYNRNLAKPLAGLGHKITLITSRQDVDEPSLEIREGITVHRLLDKHIYWPRSLPIMGRYMRPFYQLMFSRQVAVKIAEISEECPPEIIEFAEVGANGYWYLRKSRRRPVVIRCHTPTFVLERYHSLDELLFDTRFTTAMEKFCIRRADALTAPSNHMAKTIERECCIQKGVIKPIPNVLDVKQFQRSGKDYSESFDSEEIVILHVGRLERVKGIEVLAKAIPRILEKVPNAKFVFIGAARSDEKSIMWKTFLKQKGGNQVNVLGCLDERELLDWYRRADVAVVPSLNYESFSYTCAQAMAAGLPVVASRIGGIPETVDDCVSGLLFEPGNAEELVKAVVSLTTDIKSRQQMGRAGRIKALKLFDAQVVADQMIEYYQSVISRHST